MAYSRGKLYIYADDEGLNIWQCAAPNSEFMMSSGWAQDYGTKGALSAVYLANKQFDDLCVRHYDEMSEKKRKKARKRIGR